MTARNIVLAEGLTDSDPRRYPRHASDRLLLQPRASPPGRTTRLVDLDAHERLVRRRELSELSLARLGLADREQTFRAMRVLLAFLRGQAGLPEALATDVGAYIDTSLVAPAAKSQQPVISEQLELDVSDTM